MHLALLTVGEAEAQMFLRGLAGCCFFFLTLSVGSYVSEKRVHTRQTFTALFHPPLVASSSVN